MPWTCRLIESPFARDFFELLPGRERPAVGDMWFAPGLLEPGKRFVGYTMSPAYRREWAAKRPPLLVRLPGQTIFCVDACAWRGGEPYGDGWTVTGEPPLITVEPSINIVGSYHGWIRGGVITDDCEGRTFAAPR